MQSLKSNGHFLNKILIFFLCYITKNIFPYGLIVREKNLSLALNC